MRSLSIVAAAHSTLEMTDGRHFTNLAERLPELTGKADEVSGLLQQAARCAEQNGGSAEEFLDYIKSDSAFGMLLEKDTPSDD